MKFLNLLKKELHELINAQMILGLVVTMLILLALGKVMSGVLDETTDETGTINICDMDDTDLTNSIISSLETTGFTVELKNVEYTEDKAKMLKDAGIESLIIIPEGFTKSIITDNQSGKMELISAMKTTSTFASLKDKTHTAVDIINSIVKNEIMAARGLDSQSVETIENPIELSETTVVNRKWADISSELLINLMQSQTMFIPIIVFVLVMITSQLIITAVSTEKIDKTLETLLSAPVSRISVLGAKMLAAAIVAVINAVVYMFGFYGYMGSMLSGAVKDAGVVGQALTVNDILKELGLKLGISGYFMVGIQMFLTIMVCLAVSMILGALVNNAKSAQTMLMPIMLLALIPYMVSMIYDINMLSPALRAVIYAIPFTHTFNAVNNIMFGNMEIYWFGLLYQLALFAVCMFFALRIFTSDKIFTISLNLGQKVKFKSKKHS